MQIKIFETETYTHVERFQGNKLESQRERPTGKAWYVEIPREEVLSLWMSMKGDIYDLLHAVFKK